MPRFRAVPLVFLLLVAGCLEARSAEAPKANRPSESARPGTWAKPLDVPGVPNLHQVSDQLYRSAQPTEEGIKNLRRMGIKTIVNLRSFHSDRDKIGRSGIGYEHIPMVAWHAEEEDVLRFLRIATDPKKTPVLVHCQHGADRTGTMSALYRIVVQGWTKTEALKEMKDGGFGFHEVWQNLVQYVNGLDIDKIQRKLQTGR